MQKNIFLKIEYLGTHYFGFQLQDKTGKREISVQQVIEGALRRLFKQNIRITYSSRTDRGVHAHGQVINFKIDTTIPLKSIKNALNVFLPDDVRVKTARRVPLDFHARFWAKSKIYRYVILNKNEPTVFRQNLSWHIAKPIDCNAMRKIAEKIIGKKDFSLFAKEEKSYESCVREVKAIDVRKRGSLVYVDIEASGFLRNMARNIVSFLVLAGSKKISFEEALAVLSRKKQYHNKPAPACGLYLMKVKY